MILKFNNSRGALLCDKCFVTVMEDFKDYEWRALNNLNVQSKQWFCKGCDCNIQRQQDQMFVDEVNKIADTYSMQQRTYLRRKYEQHS